MSFSSAIAQKIRQLSGQIPEDKNAKPNSDQVSGSTRSSTKKSEKKEKPAKNTRKKEKTTAKDKKARNRGFARYAMNFSVMTPKK
jgi:putative cell wall-binding protein